MIIGIYKITSPSGKIYIGQSVNLKKRFYYSNKEAAIAYNGFGLGEVAEHKS